MRAGRWPRSLRLPWLTPNFFNAFRIGADSRPRAVVYVELLNRTAALVRSLDPGARIWAPDVVADHTESPAFIDESLRSGDLDFFTIHTFATDVETMVAQLAQAQARAEELRPGTQVSVTAAQVLAAPTGMTPERRPTCPYVGLSEHEQARAMQDLYVCLGNAGARHVFMYKAHDRLLASCRTLQGSTSPPPDPGNPEGYEMSGLLGPHPLGSFAETIGDCVAYDCSHIHHRRKPAYWAVRAVAERAAR
ncbi:MAG: hypothetical protein K8H88_10440 [Sandaracinaceae bacterium]|nr:hypothetical protein [Sandaracinaceae bacterium]